MKNKILLALLVALVLMSGCIKIQIREDIGLLGSSNIMMSLAPVNVSAMGWDKKNPCADFKTNESSKLFSGAKCSFDGKKETITGKFDRKTAGGLTIVGTKYRFDLIKALDGFNENKSAQSQMKLQEHKNVTQIKQAKDSGFAYDYIVKLPGTVTSQSGGQVQSDGSVKFDLLELEAGDNPYVESDTGVGGLLSLGSKKPSVSTGDDQPAGIKNDVNNDIKINNNIFGNLSCPCIPALTLLLAGLGAAVNKVIQ
jgi:hypothetical protein